MTTNQIRSEYFAAAERSEEHAQKSWRDWTFLIRVAWAIVFAGSVFSILAAWQFTPWIFLGIPIFALFAAIEIPATRRQRQQFYDIWTKQVAESRAIAEELR